MRPSCGWAKPVIRLRSVLLPAPLPPMTARLSPLITSKLTFLNAKKRSSLGRFQMSFKWWRISFGPMCRRNVFETPWQDITAILQIIVQLSFKSIEEEQAKSQAGKCDEGQFGQQCRGRRLGIQQNIAQGQNQGRYWVVLINFLVLLRNDCERIKDRHHPKEQS